MWQRDDWWQTDRRRYGEMCSYRRNRMRLRDSAEKSIASRLTLEYLVVRDETVWSSWETYRACCCCCWWWWWLIAVDRAYETNIDTASSVYSCCSDDNRAWPMQVSHSDTSFTAPKPLNYAHMHSDTHTDKRVLSAFLCATAGTAIAHLSHRNFVCPSVTRVDQAKTVQARIIKSSPSAAPKTLVSGSVTLFQKFHRGHPNRGP